MIPGLSRLQKNCIRLTAYFNKKLPHFQCGSSFLPFWYNAWTVHLFFQSTQLHITAAFPAHSVYQLSTAAADIKPAAVLCLTRTLFCRIFFNILFQLSEKIILVHILKQTSAADFPVHHLNFTDTTEHFGIVSTVLPSCSE